MCKDGAGVGVCVRELRMRVRLKELKGIDEQGYATAKYMQFH